MKLRWPGTWRRSARRGPQEPLFAVEPGALRQTSVGEIALRFFFGGLISVGAGVVGWLFGPHPAGLFLAFPAILPATLTLIAAQDSTRSAVHDDDGALIGSLGLVTFALLAWWLLPRHGATVALGAAALGWLVTSVAGYLGTRFLWGEPKPRARR